MFASAGNNLAVAGLTEPNGVQFVPAGTVPLAETTFATWERVTVPFARVPRFQRTTRTQYEGTLNVQLPTSNGCPSVPVGTGHRSYQVLGQTPDGQPGERTAVIPMVLEGGATQVSDTISARTTAARWRSPPEI